MSTASSTADELDSQALSAFSGCIEVRGESDLRSDADRLRSQGLRPANGSLYSVGVTFLRFALVLSGLVLTACYPSQRVARSQAVEDFECSRSDLRVRRRSEDLFVVSGCGRRGLYQCPTGPGISSRFCVNLMLMAKTRATEEFSCDELNVREISPFIFRVEGCGQAASYHCEANDAQPQCLREAEPVPLTPEASEATEEATAQVSPK